jgi:hypothetical protein
MIMWAAELLSIEGGFSLVKFRDVLTLILPDPIVSELRGRRRRKKGIFQVKKEYAYLQFVYTGAVLRQHFTGL